MALWGGIPRKLSHCSDDVLSLTLNFDFTVLVAFSSFATAAYTSEYALTPDRIFPAISLFGMLQFPLNMVRPALRDVCLAVLAL